MKKNIFLIVLLSFLTACTQTPSNSSYTSSSSSHSNDSTDSTSSSLSAEIFNNISEAKLGTMGNHFIIKGVVAQLTYSYDGPVGMYVVDNTGSMYVYGGVSNMSNIKVGNTIIADGNIDYYISQQEKPAGDEIGYQGGQQLRANTISVFDDSVSDFPTDSIGNKTIKEISKTNFRNNDLSGTIFKTKATLTKMDVSGTDVYYFNDLSMDYSIYTYSTMSGTDFEWLNEYVSTSKEWYLAVHSLRSRDEAWRVIPIKPLGDVTITDKDNANFALDRLADQFQESYNSTTSIELLSEDSKLLKEAIISYTSSSEHTTITNENNKYYLNIDANFIENVEITIKLVYKGQTYERVVNISIESPKDFGEITISEARLKNDGEIVTIKGVFVRQAANVKGVYIADETGIMVVYHDKSFDYNNYIIGETLVFKGEVTTDFDIEGVYNGYKRLSNATLLSNESVSKEWNKNLVEGNLSLKELQNTFTVEMIGKIFEIEGIVQKIETPYYSNFKFIDSNDSRVSNAIYCGSASDIPWLDDYVDETHTYYVFIRDSKSGSAPRIELLDIKI